LQLYVGTRTGNFVKLQVAASGESNVSVPVLSSLYDRLAHHVVARGRTLAEPDIEVNCEVDVFAPQSFPPLVHSEFAGLAARGYDAAYEAKVHPPTPARCENAACP
jgi:hypothetical protein